MHEGCQAVGWLLVSVKPVTYGYLWLFSVEMSAAVLRAPGDYPPPATGTTAFPVDSAGTWGIGRNQVWRQE